MRLGVLISANDPWRVFEDVYQYLRSHYVVDLFEPRQIKTPILHHRINRMLFHRELDSFLRSHDVVFFEWASELLAAATHLPKRCSIVTRLHRYELFSWAAAINWDVVDRIILVSQAMQRKFVAQFPAQAHKTVVVPVGVSLEQYRPHEKPFAGDIGTVCYLTPRKRVYELILAFHELTQQRDRFHLHVAGGQDDASRDYYDALRSLVHRLKLQDKVTFHGEIKRAWEWYRNIDIFVSNSFSEGLQAAPIEAMASGCYTLSHHWDGADELLPEANLFLTEHELRQRILSYDDASEAERRLRQEEMRAIACERFDLRHVESRIHKVIEEVASIRSADVR